MAGVLNAKVVVYRGHLDPIHAAVDTVDKQQCNVFALRRIGHNGFDVVLVPMNLGQRVTEEHVEVDKAACEVRRAKDVNLRLAVRVAVTRRPHTSARTDLTFTGQGCKRYGDVTPRAEVS